ncbi:class A sortase [Streptococcus pantholopis]|uniref:Sortase n=1 Tax=Streptococcus pantholopis TaxID=1811193 RepID=A0A172Q7J1_9STRE|nr:class A sortase [Streptococcus pantholopis]AND79375.1 sortase [Streptococcus pantholopis]
MKKRSTHKPKKSKIKNFFRWLVFSLLLILGLALIFNKSIRNTLIAWNSNKYQVSNISRKTLKENAAKKASYDFEAVESVSTEAILEAQMAAQKLPVIGGIAIPDIGINLPIFKGLGNTELMYGAGTMKEEQVMGGENNYALASHHVFGINGSSQMLFSPLTKAKIGMKIYLTDKEMIYTYIIDRVDAVSPDHIEVLNDSPGNSEVTLVTCTDAEATNRIIVHGTLEASVAFDQAASDIKKAFNTSYNQISL